MANRFIWSILPTLKIQGMQHFSGDNILEAGIYILVSADKAKLLEFIVDQDQHFEIILESIAGQAVFNI